MNVSAPLTAWRLEEGFAHGTFAHGTGSVKVEKQGSEQLMCDEYMHEIVIENHVPTLS